MTGVQTCALPIYLHLMMARGPLIDGIQDAVLHRLRHHGGTDGGQNDKADDHAEATAPLEDEQSEVGERQADIGTS